jgi:hypothetical protein
MRNLGWLKLKPALFIQRCVQTKPNQDDAFHNPQCWIILDKNVGFV